MEKEVLNFKVLIEQDEDGIFVASVPAVPGCFSQGKTYEEVLANVKDALNLCLEEAKDNQQYAAKINFPKNKEADKFIGVADIPMRFAFA